MNVAAVILLFIGLILSIASLVFLGLPALTAETASVGGNNVFSIFTGGFADIFRGLQANFKNYFDFGNMFAVCNSNGDMPFFYLVVGFLVLAALLLLIHFILMCAHRKWYAFGAGILWAAIAFFSYMLLVVFLIPVVLGRSFNVYDAALNIWKPTTDADSLFMNIIAYVKEGGYADYASVKTKTMVLLPFILACSGILLSFVGCLISIVDAGRKKKSAPADAKAQKPASESPIQVIVQNVPGKDRVIVVPSEINQPPRQAGPQMVQYITTADEADEEENLATESDARKAVRAALYGEAAEKAPGPIGQRQSPETEEYLTQDEARRAVREALANKGK
ncbi:MAG: hypothetical protein LKK13_04570 [Bacilli bacterium]|jgi:hypothetical protein|nr:hypothetical protein [Bacilli bacterium]